MFMDNVLRVSSACITGAQVTTVFDIILVAFTNGGIGSGPARLLGRRAANGQSLLFLTFIITSGGGGTKVRGLRAFVVVMDRSGCIFAFLSRPVNCKQHCVVFILLLFLFFCLSLSHIPIHHSYYSYSYF